MNEDARREFVDAWGSMGSLWGISRSVARVHALLMASDGPLSLDEIAGSLGISKGNASMSLRDLRAYGVVRPAPAPEAGDRRDYWATEPDVWEMFFRILSERKRRELDPAVAAVRRTIETAGAGSGPARDRLAQMADLLDSIDSVASRLLRNQESARTALRLLARLPGAASARGRSASARRPAR